MDNIKLTNPFKIDEVLNNLILFMDRDQIENFYLSNKELLENKLILQRLAKHHNLSNIPNSFSDFIIMWDLEAKKNTCLTIKSKLILAIKYENIKLVKEFIKIIYDNNDYLDPFSNTDDDIFTLATKLGNKDIIIDLINVIVWHM